MTGRIMIIAGVALILLSFILRIMFKKKPLSYENELIVQQENPVMQKALPDEMVSEKKTQSDTEILVKEALKNINKR